MKMERTNRATRIMIAPVGTPLPDKPEPDMTWILLGEVAMEEEN